MRVSGSVILERFAYTPTEVQGRLKVGPFSFYTIEKPWVPGRNPGGENFASCIPDGSYEVERYLRTNGSWSLRLVNEDLGVYRHKSDRGPTGGRWACLIHAGNFVEDVVGCIAPGRSRTIYQNRIMVGSSRSAMEDILEHAGSRLYVHPYGGTRTKEFF